MITSAQNYTKTNKKKNPDRQNPRTNGKSKSIQNHTQKHTHTHSQKEKKGIKYIYRCSQCPPQIGRAHV